MELNNLNDMTAFVASVKSGSFTAAAKQLGLTRSTIGKRIARLEARLNVRLLQRNTRNLAPTDEGRLFYERCTAVLEELENAEQCLAQRSIEPQGRLKILKRHSRALLEQLGVGTLPAFRRPTTHATLYR